MLVLGCVIHPQNAGHPIFLFSPLPGHRSLLGDRSQRSVSSLSVPTYNKQISFQVCPLLGTSFAFVCS